jgi:hypothetical protein
MSEKVSAFWPVHIGKFQYLFFVINWNDFSNTITESLERNFEILGQEIGLAGKVVQAYKSARWETFKEVKKKDGWPHDVFARFDSEQYPFMLVINTNFEEFSPKEDLWTVIWFSDFRDNPDTISEIFGNLVKKIRQDENLFVYFKNLAVKQTTKELAEYFEIKPGAFGISVDVNAILEDLGKSMQKRLGK